MASVGINWSPVVSSGNALLWSQEFTTAAAGKTAFIAAPEYSPYWTLESSGFNLGPGGGEHESGDWNRDEQNVVVSAASSGGTGNSLKLNGIRHTITVPSRACPGTAGGILTVPFTTGGINNTPAFGIKMGQRVSIRMKKTNGDLGGTSLIGGNRACIWVTSHNLPTGAEIDFPEYFGSTGTSNTPSSATCQGDQALGNLGTKRDHYIMFWSYSGSGAQRMPGHEVNANDTNWNIFDYEFRNRSIKIFRNGQLMVHWGDPPWDSRAIIPPLSPGIPYKWASDYNGGGSISNPNGWVYPAPYDASNNQRLKLTQQIGGNWCMPIEPAALAAAQGTICYQQEIDYVRVYDTAIPL